MKMFTLRCSLCKTECCIIEEAVDGAFECSEVYAIQSCECSRVSNRK